MIIRTFKEYAKTRLKSLCDDNPNITTEQLIDAFPHKAQTELFDEWKKEVKQFNLKRETLKALPTKNS